MKGITLDDSKIIEIFGDLVINKSLVRQIDVRGSRTIPSFVEEYLVTKFSEPGENVATTKLKILEFIQKHLPAKTEKDVFLNRLHNGHQVTIFGSGRFDEECKIY